MTSKERMLCALERGMPDRLPVTVHQWQPYHLKKYMGGMSDIEANKVCGLDASINVYEVGKDTCNTWKVSSTSNMEKGCFVTHYTIKTPGGILTTSEGSDPMTTWVLEPLIKNEEDIRLIQKYRPVPKLNRRRVMDTYTALGDGGILRTFVWGRQSGCWQDACELYGVENLILQTYDDPDWVHELLEILLEQKLEYIEENLPGLPFDLVETGGGASSNTVISPAIHKEFCQPYDRRMHDALKKHGFKSVYHTCGGMTQISDLVAGNHCDVSETLSPAAVGGDIKSRADEEKVYSTLHQTVGLIGGMDQFHILETGTREEIESEVNRLFESFGKDGGYILSACDHFFEVPPQNLIYFAEAAKKITYSTTDRF